MVRKRCSMNISYNEYKSRTAVRVPSLLCVVSLLLFAGCVHSFSLGSFGQCEKPVSKLFFVGKYKIKVLVAPEQVDSTYIVSCTILDTAAGTVINQANAVLEIQKKVKNQFAGVRQSPYKDINISRTESAFDSVSGTFRFRYRNLSPGHYMFKITISAITGSPLEEEIAIHYTQEII